MSRHLWLLHWRQAVMSHQLFCLVFFTWVTQTDFSQYISWCYLLTSDIVFLLHSSLPPLPPTLLPCVVFMGHTCKLLPVHPVMFAHKWTCHPLAYFLLTSPTSTFSNKELLFLTKRSHSHNIRTHFCCLWHKDPMATIAQPIYVVFDTKIIQPQ